MNDFITFVAGVGFPIVVAGYLLIKIDPAVRAMTEAIAKLTGVIEKCQK